MLRYVLITPAHNEDRYIGETCRTVVSQTHLPERWIIVNDGSIDDTGAIAREFARNHPFITVIDMPTGGDRHFSRKAQCFTRGAEALGKTAYDVIGNLDGDISFDDNDYFAFLMKKFEESPDLGVAGTPFVEGSFHSYRDSRVSPDHVHGGVQMFRRPCFEEIGGYKLIPGGGIDKIAVMTARMNGWATRSFQEKAFNHLKPLGTGGSGKLSAFIKTGRKDYLLGNPILWQIPRSFFQMKNRPYVLSGFLIFWGFFRSWIVREQRPIGDDLVQFNRRELARKITGIFRRRRVPDGPE